MDAEVIMAMLYNKESELLDFKRDQYPFYGASNTDKAKLLKDILAFANAWKTSDARILIGVNEVVSGPAETTGVTDHLKDADLQQFVNSKTNRPVKFLCGTVQVDGHDVDVIKIAQEQDRPIFLKADFGGLKKEAVYVRRGSSTNIASPDEVSEMGRSYRTAATSAPVIELELCDPKQRKRFGSAVECFPRILVDPPKREVDPETPREFLKAQGLGVSSQILANTLRPIRMPRIEFSSMFRSPSEEEKRKYREQIALIANIGFWAKNAGTCTASDVRVEVAMSKPDGVQVFDETEHPENRTSLSLGHSIKSRVHSNVVVQEFPEQWLVSASFGKIQPQEEVWLTDMLYLKSSENLLLEASAKVFADNLPCPIELDFTFKLTPQEMEYKAEDWEPKEKDRG